MRIHNNLISCMTTGFNTPLQVGINFNNRTVIGPINPMMGYLYTASVSAGIYGAHKIAQMIVNRPQLFDRLNPTVQIITRQLARDSEVFRKIAIYALGGLALASFVHGLDHNCGAPFTVPRG